MGEWSALSYSFNMVIQSKIHTIKHNTDYKTINIWCYVEVFYIFGID